LLWKRFLSFWPILVKNHPFRSLSSPYPNEPVPLPFSKWHLQTFKSESSAFDPAGRSSIRTKGISQWGFGSALCLGTWTGFGSKLPKRAFFFRVAIPLDFEISGVYKIAWWFFNFPKNFWEPCLAQSSNLTAPKVGGMRVTLHLLPIYVVALLCHRYSWTFFDRKWHSSSKGSQYKHDLSY
jgi:hypothetical protein